MNQQLMQRKEDMEWQLMSVLAQVPACVVPLADIPYGPVPGDCFCQLCNAPVYKMQAHT